MIISNHIKMRHVWRKHRTYIDSKGKFISRLAMEMLLYVVLQIWDVVTGILWLVLTPLVKLYEILRLR